MEQHFTLVFVATYLKCKLPDDQIHLWNELIKLGEKARETVVFVLKKSKCQTTHIFSWSGLLHGLYYL